MTITNKGLRTILAPTFGLLLLLTSVAISQGNIRRHDANTAGPSQEMDTMRGTFLRTAQRIGRSDGIKAGRQDRKRGEPSNSQDEKNYQNGTHGYSPRMGDKEKYKQVYRSAFENGYRDGWNGY